MKTNIKKLYRIGIITLISLCQSANAEEFCGLIRNTTSMTTTPFTSQFSNNSGIYCINGTGQKNYRTFNTSYEYVCVTYIGTQSDAVNHIFLQNCDIDNYACSENSRWTTYTGCIECPDGHAASSSIGYHFKADCDFNLCRHDYFMIPTGKCMPCTGYGVIIPPFPHSNNYCTCMEGYYWNDTMCEPCPNGGRTYMSGSGPTDITECFLDPGLGSDMTGEFTLSAECYYEE